MEKYVGAGTLQGPGRGDNGRGSTRPGTPPSGVRFGWRGGIKGTDASGYSVPMTRGPPAGISRGLVFHLTPIQWTNSRVEFDVRSEFAAACSRICNLIMQELVCSGKILSGIFIALSNGFSGMFDVSRELPPKHSVVHESSEISAFSGHSLTGPALMGQRVVPPLLPDVATGGLYRLTNAFPP